MLALYQRNMEMELVALESLHGEARDPPFKAVNVNKTFSCI